MIRQYERRGGALVLVDYYNDDDPDMGEAVVPETRANEVKEPENSTT